MTNWLTREAKYVLQRRHKLDAGDLVQAPRFLACSGIANGVFGELDREAMLEEFETWRYGEPGRIDASLLRETEDDRRGVTAEEVGDGIDLGRPFVSRIAGEDSDPAFVGGPTPLTLAPDGRIVREVAKNNRSQINALVEALLPAEWFRIYREARSGQLSATTHLDGDVLPLFGRKYPNYYHWLLDELPKLRALDAYPGDARVAIGAETPPYVTQSLEHLGFGDYVRVGDSTATADGVLAAMNRTPPFVNLSYVSERYVEWLRERATEGRERSGGERIYISRENSQAREVVNREELLTELRELGFRSYTLETRSFEENVRLFANAEAVVGPHGAGFTDLLFAEDAAVVELNTLSKPQPAFYLLARQSGNRYRHVTCPAVGTAQYDVQRKMRADVEEVVGTVARALERETPARS